jgi:hypothetical protein
VDSSRSPVVLVYTEWISGSSSSHTSGRDRANSMVYVASLALVGREMFSRDAERYWKRRSMPWLVHPEPITVDSNKCTC